jgi:hypothetical protein
MYPRTLEPAMVRASQQFPVVLLTGARQVGKTTLLRQLSQDGRAYVTLDDPLVLTATTVTRSSAKLTCCCYRTGSSIRWRSRSPRRRAGTIVSGASGHWSG